MAIERRIGRVRFTAATVGLAAVLVATVMASSPAGFRTGGRTLLGVVAGSAVSAQQSDGSASAIPSGTPLTTLPAAPSETPTAQVLPTQTPLPPAPTAATTAPPLPPPPPTAPPAPPAPTPAPPSTGWVVVVNDQFNSGGLPSHWQSYDGPYGSGPGNCAVPSHAVVSGGYLHLVMSYETSGSLPCGPGWYTGGLALSGHSSVDQRVTVRFRVIDAGVASHFIIPMRWPDGDGWPAAGEEDFCETDTTSGCTTFLHYGSSNSQNQHSYGVDLSQWHTLRFERLNHVVSAFIDDMAGPVWSFSGDAGNLPDTLKHVVLQQECQSSCPAGTDGTEDIQIDWITVENPG